MSNSNENQSGEHEGNSNEQQENNNTPVDAGQNNSPTPAVQPRQSRWDFIKSFGFRIVMFYFVTQFFRGSPKNNTAGNVTSPGSSIPGYTPGNLFAKGDLLDMYLFINEEEIYAYEALKRPIWEIDGLKYGDWSSEGTYTKFIEFPISKNVQNNGSLYLHVVVTKHGNSIDPDERESHSPQFVFSKSKRLNRYKKKVYKKTKNLLTGNTEQDEEYQKKAEDKLVELLSHWHSNMTINLLDDQSPWAKGSVPPPMDKYIQFWRTRKSLEGLSVRSVFFNIFQSFIVLLYVFDNEANTMVRISVSVGIIIELWKVPKVLNFERAPNETWLGFIPKYKYVYKQSYTDTSTSDHDRMAFKYLSWMLFPLVIGYACYLLMYHEQKSWYSFCLSTIYGFLLTFGFIMMTPQLFINYKLKSVSHLPWRMMTYKALNTFIDDLFAFVIKMPTMYRIGCFRDDIIFFIYLYQRYIYPVDRKRLNEFGTSGEPDSALVATGEQSQTDTSTEQHAKTD
ncbi:unnamed protein product [Rotaria socialis]|uniref:Cleft lip and palate associated transmembrane protein n=1 Tax=Rotaria socialis TaxID=392032 RepID=A0A820BFL4_9BILA|nr:unnamed protein product [Rotaria socialis]